MHPLLQQLMQHLGGQQFGSGAIMGQPQQMPPRPQTFGGLQPNQGYGGSPFGGNQLQRPMRRTF